jgi:uncharacterized protein (TIGR02246 family)
MKNLFLAMGAVAMLACNKPAEETFDLAAARAEIEAMEQAYATAQNARDVEAILVYYADDAQRLEPGKAPVVGKDAIRASLAESLADSMMIGATMSATTLDVFAEGNLAVETGSWMMSKPDGSSMTGKFVSVFEKREGKYVCIRDTWNMEASTPAPAPPADTTAAPTM